MERRPVVQSVLPTEIQQRKPVTEYQQIPAALRHDLTERLIQRLQRRQIVRQPRPEAVRVVGIRLTQPVGDGAAQRHGRHRRRPDMLVVFDLLAVVLVLIMVMVVMGRRTALHPLDKLLLPQLCRVHHGQDAGDVLSGGVQNVRHPLLALAAVVDEHIRLTDADHVHGRGLEAVRLPSGGHHQRHVHVVAADLPGEIVVGEQGADHLDFSVLRQRRLAAGGQRHCQHEGQQSR